MGSFFNVWCIFQKWVCLTLLTLKVDECAKVKLVSTKIKSITTNRPCDFAQTQLFCLLKAGIGEMTAMVTSRSDMV